MRVRTNRPAETAANVVIVAHGAPSSGHVTTASRARQANTTAAPLRYLHTPRFRGAGLWPDADAFAVVLRSEGPFQGTASSSVDRVSTGPSTVSAYSDSLPSHSAASATTRRAVVTASVWTTSATSCSCSTVRTA